MRLNDSTRYREPQPHSVASFLLSLPEAVEYVRQFFGRDSAAGVTHAEFDARIALLGANLHATAGRGEFEGVPPKVGEDLENPFPVGDDAPS